MCVFSSSFVGQLSVQTGSCRTLASYCHFTSVTLFNLQGEFCPPERTLRHAALPQALPVLAGAERVPGGPGLGPAPPHGRVPEQAAPLPGLDHRPRGAGQPPRLPPEEGLGP